MRNYVAKHGFKINRYKKIKPKTAYSRKDKHPNKAKET